VNFLLPEHFGYIPETEKAKIMESTAKARYIRQSARKVRKMLDLVRGENVEKALNVLHFSPQKASKVIEGTIHSAVANMLQTEEGKTTDPEILLIKEAFVDEGPTMRRFRAGAMGRVKRIRKRSSHLTIVLTDEKS
jgi:large subunit ribosomal protein L22